MDCAVLCLGYSCLVSYKSVCLCKKLKAFADNLGTQTLLFPEKRILNDERDWALWKKLQKCFFITREGVKHWRLLHALEGGPSNQISFNSIRCHDPSLSMSLTSSNKILTFILNWLFKSILIVICLIIIVLVNGINSDYLQVNLLKGEQVSEVKKVETLTSAADSLAGTSYSDRNICLRHVWNTFFHTKIWLNYRTLRRPIFINLLTPQSPQ